MEIASNVIADTSHFRYRTLYARSGRNAFGVKYPTTDKREFEIEGQRVGKNE